MDYFDLAEAEIREKLNQIQIERSNLFKTNQVGLLDEKTALKTLFETNLTKAKLRNDRLLKEYEDTILNNPNLKIDKNSREEIQLSTLRKNYWSMVRSVYPIWLNEMDEYKNNKKERKSKKSEIINVIGKDDENQTSMTMTLVTMINPSEQKQQDSSVNIQQEKQEQEEQGTNKSN